MPIRFSLVCVAVLGLMALVACSGANGDGFTTTDDAGGGQDAGTTPQDGGGTSTDAATFGETGSPPDASGAGVSIIYANTDTELYSMDPKSHAVTDIGPFQGMAACGTNTAVTDLAINGNDEVWVNTECALYQATLPASGTGPVQLTLKTKISGATGQKFFALGFAPAGVLGAGEGLVAGDSLGELFYIDTATGATQDLGGFGTDASGKAWQLSGDVVFYTQGGVALGLATIRTKTTATAMDSLAEIDMQALAAAFTSKTPGTLLKKIYGTNTGFAKLFGVGAWGNDVFAFSRVGTTDPAQLVQIDATGTGTSLQSFAAIKGGWSGAGVTTKASITIPPPK
jgi:hypothetical protein